MIGKDDFKWPLEPGNYIVGSPSSPIAISTLSDDDLIEALHTELNMDHYALLGTTMTPNIGVEKLVRNIVCNPSISYLILAGKDDADPKVSTVILALHQHGVSEGMRVIGLRRSITLKNLTVDEINEFRSRVRVIDMVDVRDPDEISRVVTDIIEHEPHEGERPAEGCKVDISYRVIIAEDAPDVKLDEKGFFVIYIDRTSRRIICEHYDNTGRKTTEIIGETARAVYKTAVGLGLVSKLDHAAYLGKELARAECALRNGSKYVQDKA